MAKYRHYDYSQGKFIPVSFDKQILPGAFEHTLHYLADSGFHSEKNMEMHSIKYHGTKRDCLPCDQRVQCLKHPDVTETRQFSHFTGRTDKQDKTFSQKMREKIDTVAGKLLYGRCMATIEPVFADIRSSLGLDRFSLRGKQKVGIQWQLYCTVHNLLKVHRYGFGFPGS